MSNQTKYQIFDENLPLAEIIERAARAARKAAQSVIGGVADIVESQAKENGDSEADATTVRIFALLTAYHMLGAQVDATFKSIEDCGPSFQPFMESLRTFDASVLGKARPVEAQNLRDSMSSTVAEALRKFGGGPN